MSHELRTPLNSILVLANLLREDRAGTLSEKQKKFAQVIAARYRRLRSMYRNRYKEYSSMTQLTYGQVRLSNWPVHRLLLDGM